MLKKTFLLVLAGLFFMLPASGVSAQEPTNEDLRNYKIEIWQFENDLKSYLNQQTNTVGSGTELMVFEKNFSVNKKSSSLTRAVRRANNALKAQVQAWVNFIAAHGYAPVENPAPITKLDHEWGLSGLKYYVQLKLYIKVWCMKMPREISSPADARPAARPAILI